MPYVFDRLRDEAAALLTATGLVPEALVSLAEPRQKELADLAFPTFAAAKAAAQAPPPFAERVAGAIVPRPDGLIAAAVAAGGFVNFTVAPDRLAEAVLAQVQEAGAAYGDDATIGAGQRLVLEFSSPNIARKMHIGHLRTTVIGHSLQKILLALGYTVIADNHLGDWGTQFGMLLAAIDKDGLTPWDDPDPVQSLVEIYAAFNAAAKEDPALKDAARAWFVKLEDGDSWARAIWQKLIDITLVEFDRTYARLGVSFDTTHGESYFEPMLDALIDDAIAKGVARQEDGGAVAVDFDGALPSCLLRKSDGATLYQTRDAATCLYRLTEYGPLVKNIYVVGAEQKLHFRQVFEIVRRLGYPEIADVSVHIPFGQVTAPQGGRFSMRMGNVVYLEDVLDEAVDRATAKIRENIEAGRSELTEAEIASVGETVGIGAVIYFDLHQGPDRNIAFDWDKMLAFDGNTGVYIQYTHARCRSILRKAGARVPGALGILTAPEEQAVIKQLARLPHALREAGEKFAPATIAEWTYTLAREYARFYHACPVLEAPTPALRAARLDLTAAVAQGLANGLALLGIRAPEKM
jgi:arginyl-tRNA synthetase